MVTARVGGMELAASDDVIVCETNVYFPLANVDTSKLHANGRRMQCPWKGEAVRYDVVIGAERLTDAAWSYPSPTAAASELTDRVAFLPMVEVIGVNGRARSGRHGNGQAATPTGDPGVDLLDPELYAGDPYPTYAWLRDHAPVYWSEASGLYGISRYEDIKAIELDPDLFSSSCGMRPLRSAEHVELLFRSFIDQDGPIHTARRRVVSRHFTPAGLAVLQPAARQIVTELVDAVAAKGTCDFVTDLAEPLPARITCRLLGLPEERFAEFAALAQSLLDVADDRTPRPAASDSQPRTGPAWATLLTNLSEDRLARPGSDLFSEMVRALETGPFQAQIDLTSDFLLLLIAGIDTTRGSAIGAMIELDRDPGQRELLRQDPSLLPRAVEEFLRYVSPVLNQTRTVTRDTELRGVPLRPGDRLYLMYPSANRDPSVFADPERFDITRHPNPHLAFGFGTHFCLGAHLARMELRVLYEELMRRLPDIRVVPGTEIAWEPSSHIRRLLSLPVEFTPA